MQYVILHLRASLRYRNRADNILLMCEQKALSGMVPMQPPPQALRFSQSRGERLVMSCKGPWEGYRQQAKPVVSFPPSFAREEETSGYEAGTDAKSIRYSVNVVEVFNAKN